MLIDSYCVYTNKVPAGAMRGFGVPQVAWAYEQQMDIIAEALGMDPIDIRRLNLLKEGDVFHTGQIIEDVAFDRLLEKTALGIGMEAEKAADPGSVRPRGKGVALCIKGTATPSTSGAYLKMNADGSVALMCNTVEMGQGIRAVLKQIISEELELPPDRITVLDRPPRGALRFRHVLQPLYVPHGQRDSPRPADLKASSSMRPRRCWRQRRKTWPSRAALSPPKASPIGASPSPRLSGGRREQGSIMGRGVYRTSGGFDRATGQGPASFYWMSACGGAGGRG